MAEIIGLDIGTHSIKLVGIKTTSKGPFLTSLGMKEIPPGTNKEDTDKLSQILKALFEEAGLKTKKVNLTVSGSGIYIKRISIPTLPKAELKEAVRWEIKDSLPFPIETAQIDFHILNEYVEDKIKKLDLIAVACPKEHIDRTLSIAEAAGLQVTHLDVGPFALWNVLLALGQVKKEETVALIDLGAEKTGIYLFQDRNLQFVREVSPAGLDLTKAILEGIGSSENQDLLYERAEGIKKEMGIPWEGYQKRGSELSLPPSKLAFLVRPVMEKMVAEIERSLEYFRNLFNTEKINRVLLTGGGANLKHIALYLSKELRVPVEPFNPLKNLLFDSKKVDFQLIEQMGPSFTTVFGISLSGPKRIELRPFELSLLSKTRIRKFFPVLAFTLLLLLFLGIFLYTHSQIDTLKKERDVKMAKIIASEGLEAKIKLLKERDLQLKEKLSRFPSSMLSPIPYRSILQEVSQHLPDNGTLILLSIQNKGKSLKQEVPTELGKELHLAGITFGSDGNCLTALAFLIERLEKSTLFRNAKLLSADENKLYSRPGAGFEIVCDLNVHHELQERKKENP